MQQASGNVSFLSCNFSDRCSVTEKICVFPILRLPVKEIEQILSCTSNIVTSVWKKILFESKKYTKYTIACVG
jgi:hypothetical protein